MKQLILCVMIAGLLVAGCGDSITSLETTSSETVELAEQTLSLSKKPYWLSMELDFNSYFFNPTPPGPQPSWYGTLSDNGTTFYIVFFPTAPPKIVGSSFHFMESVFVYDDADFSTIETDGLFTVGNLLLEGANSGVLAGNGSFVANGNVVFADGVLADWDGRKYQFHGVVAGGASPESATGRWRLN
jgi:hypothetical protein